MIAAGNETSSEASVPRPSRHAGDLTTGVIVLAAASAVVLSNDWCFVCLPVVLAAVIIDLLFRRIGARHVRSSRLRGVIRLGLGAATGMVAGLLMSVGPEWAFREAFEARPPQTVRSVRIWRHYLGGPGEHILIIEFYVDDDSFKALVKSLPPAQDESQVMRRWESSSHDWKAAFDAFGGGGITLFAMKSWMSIPPINNPQVFDFGGVHNGNLVVLREPSTGRCVALHVRY